VRCKKVLVASSVLCDLNLCVDMAHEGDFLAFRQNFASDFRDIEIHDYVFLTDDELEELCTRSHFSLRQKLTARRFKAGPSALRAGMWFSDAV
jgi:hypothetical protein